MQPIQISNPVAELSIQQPTLKIYLAAHPFGAGGAALSASAFYEAGEILNAGRAVVSESNKVYRFNPNNPSHVRGIVGFTKTSAITGAMVEVVFAGYFEDIGLSLTPDAPVFAGLNGVLSGVPPVSGIVYCVGTAVTDKKFLISLKNPIIV